MKDIGKLVTSLALGASLTVIPSHVKAEHPETCQDVPAFVRNLMLYESVVKAGVDFAHIQPFPSNLGNNYFECVRKTVETESNNKIEMGYEGRDRNNVYYIFKFRKPETK